MPQLPPEPEPEPERAAPPPDDAAREPIAFTPRAAPIALGQLLKHVLGLSGGQAKQLIREGQVRVDGAVETRRGRRLRGGERVSVTLGEARVSIEVSAPS